MPMAKGGKAHRSNITAQRYRAPGAPPRGGGRAKRAGKADRAERGFKETLRHVSTAELLAMCGHFEHMERDSREEWSEEDEPLMRRLLALMQKARRDEP
jgi:hypothetical protein